MPIIYVSRDTFTEPLALLFLMGGLALLYRAVDTGRTLDFAAAGFVTSVAAVVRIDAYAALLSLLVLPLYVPVLIIGAGAAEAAVSGLGGRAQLLLLGALLAFAGAFAPWAAAAALRISSE